MAKVIVERPRKKGWAWNKPKGYQRRLRAYGSDGPPCREGIKSRWQGHTKDLNEHLGPLRRYIDSQVGRPWDKVFSEICAHIDRSSAVQDHVRDHVEDYVTVNVILIDGTPCDGEGGWNYGKPLQEMGWRPWYVCPRTGLLRRVKMSSRKQSRQPKKPPPRFVWISETQQCRWIDNAWHLVTLKPLPLPGYNREHSHVVDVLLRRRVVTIGEEEARRQYGAEVYAVAARRLGRRDLRQLPVTLEFCTSS